MPSVKNITVAGYGTAANPLSVFLSPRGQVKIDTDFFTASPSDALQLFSAIATDDAMTGDAIRRGDMVVARQQFTASDGDLVLVLLGDALVVRRLVQIGSVGELSASNGLFPAQPFSQNTANVAIIGVVVGLLRKF